MSLEMLRHRGSTPPTEGTPSSLLSVDDLSVAYQRVVRALHGVSLVLGDGETVALLGANGAGKTTLLRAITGLLPLHQGTVTGGSVLLAGRPIAQLDPAAIVRCGLTQAMEGRRTFAELTVEENLRVGGFTQRDQGELAAAYDRVFTLFPVLEARRRATAGYLSGGEQQMLAIARALMPAPRLLVMDEPSLGLAPLVVEQIQRAIAEINAQGTGVLLVEQNAEMALSISRRGYVMETGRILLSGPASLLRHDRRVRHLYLGVEEAGLTDVAELDHGRQKAVPS